MVLNHQHQITNAPKKHGVLVINIGSPKSLSRRSIRHFIQLFLSDKRVIELNPILWQIILRGFILITRPKKILRKYQSIWLKNQLSPLLKNSINLIENLQVFLDTRQKNITVRMAMNYSEPFVQDVIEKFQQENISHLIVLPLFPQYSSTTVGAALDKVWHTLLNMRFQPEISSIHHFYQHPLYIKALAEHVQNHWQQYGRSKLLLLTYHGIPARYVKKGDPYWQHCLETSYALQQTLQLDDSQIMTSFQSRFGQMQWLQPSTEELLATLPIKGIKSIDVLSPSFVLDCLETKWELNINGREKFIQAGGEIFHYIPCLNSHFLLVKMLGDIILSKLD